MWRSGADRPKGRDLNLVREAKLSCQDDPAHDDDGNDDDDGDDGDDDDDADGDDDDDGGGADGDDGEDDDGDDSDDGDDDGDDDDGDDGHDDDDDDACFGGIPPFMLRRYTPCLFRRHTAIHCVACFGGIPPVIAFHVMDIACVAILAQVSLHAILGQRWQKGFADRGRASC